MIVGLFHERLWLLVVGHKLLEGADTASQSQSPSVVGTPAASAKNSGLVCSVATQDATRTPAAAATAASAKAISCFQERKLLEESTV
jgi:hypothetical protein